MSPASSASPPWHLVIPVRSPDRGKSRLGSTFGPSRAGLARAIAEDTITAALHARSCRVVVVTDDAELTRWCALRGVATEPDPGEGLNAAVVAGYAHSGGLRRAAMLGDLPAATGQDIDAALTLALASTESFVPDLDGTGTVLRCGVLARPAFGPHSAARHAELGAVRLDLDLPRLRRDVDDARSLAEAVRLGVGVRTAAVLATARGEG